MVREETNLSKDNVNRPPTVVPHKHACVAVRNAFEETGENREMYAHQMVQGFWVCWCHEVIWNWIFLASGRLTAVHTKTGGRLYKLGLHAMPGRVGKNVPTHAKHMLLLKYCNKVTHFTWLVSYEGLRKIKVFTRHFDTFFVASWILTLWRKSIHKKMKVLAYTKPEEKIWGFGYDRFSLTDISESMVWGSK